MSAQKDSTHHQPKLKRKTLNKLNILVFVFVVALCFNLVMHEYRVYDEFFCTTILFEDISQSDQQDPYLIEFVRENVLTQAKGRYRLKEPLRRDHSQLDQGVFLEEFFQKKKGGTFIEAGAADGEFLSNTLILERLHKWTGLLVEPNPFSFQELLKKRRKCHLANCCLSTVHTPSNVAFNIAGEGGTLSHIINTTGIEIINNNFTQVECFPLYSLMAAANLTTLDLLILDLEGVEVKVLESLPWDKVNIRTILVEMNHIPEGPFYLRQLLAMNGYELLRTLTIDYFFVKSDMLSR